MHRVCLLAIFFVPFATQVAYAQDIFERSSGREGFFGNRSNSTSQENTRDVQKNKQPAAAAKDASLARKEESSFTRKSVSDFFAPEPSQKDIEKSTTGKNAKREAFFERPVEGGEPIEALSILVAHGDTKHLEELMQGLRNLQAETKIPLRDFYFIGPADKIPTDYALEVQKYEGAPKYAEHIPHGLPVTQSPTWILHRPDKSYIILEGLADIRPHMNKKGEFVKSNIQVWNEVKASPSPREEK